jgi:oxygen-independent coproporphyrinogen-3 oxidase
VTTHLDLSNIEEFTFEADPCTITSSKLKLLKQAGVSRVSIGSQSLNDVTLAEMNRIHRAKDIVEMIPLLYQQGLSNLNCDFIVGWPGQTFDDVDLFIGFLEERNIAHCSCYVLGVEDDTPLKVQLADGTQQLPPDDMTADLYHHFRLHAQKIGLIQYELSNFARPGFESKHNQAYWRHKPYIGLGAGAVSYDGAIRSKNTTNIQTYTETPQANRESETLSEQDRLNEVIMLSLRTSDGLDEGLLNSQHLVIIDRLIVSGFMKKHGHKYFINPQHYCIANSIIADLIQ